MAADPIISGGRASDESSLKDDSRQNGDNKARRRLSISLSPRSAEAFDWLKENTDADTDSEVFRNALRLHTTLLKAHLRGEKLLLASDDSTNAISVNLFVEDFGSEPSRPLNSLTKNDKNRDPK